MKKHIISTIVLVLSLAVFGDNLHAGTYSGGTGEPNNPYKIAAVADWQELMATPADWNKCFLLTADIDLVGVTLTPVGNSSTQFSGVFDGDGRVIRNATINQPGSNGIGIFGGVDYGGQIRNLGVENINITGVTGGTNVGGLVGWNYGSVTDCYSTGSVSGTAFVGGLVGFNHSGPITSCYSTVTASGNDSVGGLVGSNRHSSITSCYSTGTVSGGAGSFIGGLVGQNLYGFIADCYSTGSVSGGVNVGGLVGQSFYGSIANCYSTGAVTFFGGGAAVGGLVGSNSGSSLTSSYSTATVNGADEVGGLVGDNSGPITCCYAEGTVNGRGVVGGLVGRSAYGLIANCYSTGAVTGTASHIGGLVGYCEWLSLINCCYSAGAVSGESRVGGLVGYNEFDYYANVSASFWDSQTSGQTTSAGGIGKTTAEMKTKSTFTDTGWDFVGESANGLHDFWQIAPNDYPRLAVPDWTLAGDGTADSPYLVETAAELAKVWLRPAAYYRLTGDLDLSGISWTTAIVPEFTGVFDGNGFVISNAVINQPDREYIGIFGSILHGGRIQNLGAENVNITGSYGIGGLVGHSDESSIISCYATGSVNSSSDDECSVGGLVGDNYFGSIISSYAKVSVSGTGWDVGGLAGFNYDGSITSCRSTGTVNGGQSVGGLVGINYWGSITSCWSAATVNATGSFVGGLVGYNIHSDYGEAAVIASCYSQGTVSGRKYVGGLVGFNNSSINSCYSTGAVGGEFEVGGLVGINGGSVTVSFWDTQTSGQSNSAGGTGKTTEEMQTLATFFDAGWDFVCETANGTDDIWFMPPDDYPRLAWEYTPEFDLSVSPTTLWPANNKMMKITPAWTATDLCGQSLEVSLVDITMNESGSADDIQISDDGSIYLCAKRSGNSKARIYTLTYKACDSSGNCTTQTATVTVPHDMRK